MIVTTTVIGLTFNYSYYYVRKYVHHVDSNSQAKPWL